MPTPVHIPPWSDDVLGVVTGKAANDKDAVKKATEQFNKSFETMREMFEDARNKGDSNYKILSALNIAMIALGMALIITSAVYSAMRGAVDLVAAITAATGFGDFAALFLINPQGRLRKIHQDFVQMGIAYINWTHQTQAAWVRLVRNGFSNDEVEVFQKALKEYAADTIRLIEENTATDT